MTIGDNYAGVFGFDTVFTAIFVAVLNDLQSIATDNGNTYLNLETKEKFTLNQDLNLGHYEVKH